MTLLHLGGSHEDLVGRVVCIPISDGSTKTGIRVWSGGRRGYCIEFSFSEQSAGVGGSNMLHLTSDSKQPCYERLRVECHIEFRYISVNLLLE